MVLTGSKTEKTLLIIDNISLNIFGAQIYSMLIISTSIILCSYSTINASVINQFFLCYVF